MDEKQAPMAGDLMKFLQGFQQKMELNMEETKKSIETTNRSIEVNNRIINGRLDGIDSEVKEVNRKILENESKSQDINERMDKRLSELEREMKNSVRLRRRSWEIKESEELLDDQPAGREVLLPKKVTVNEGMDGVGVKKYGNKVDKVTEAILKEPVGTFRSSWARSMEKELQIAAGEIDRSEKVVMGPRKVLVEKQIVTNVERIGEEEQNEETPDLVGGEMEGGTSNEKPESEECTESQKTNDSTGMVWYWNFIG